VFSIIGTILAFAIIIARKHLRMSDFGLAMVVGSLVMGIFSLGRIEPGDIPKAFIEALFYSFSQNRIQTDTLELALLMGLILSLARALQETGGIEKLVESLRIYLPHGETLGLIPSIYGLMPMVGGAMLSAPMIDSEGDRYGLNQHQKNFLNIWFRHMWMPVYPVSSAMILVCSHAFADIPIHELISMNIPMFLAFMAIGIFLIKRFLKIVPKSTSRASGASGFIYFIPILAPLLVYGLLLPLNLDQKRTFMIGIVFSIALVWIFSGVSASKYAGILYRSVTINVFSAIFGIMIFRQFVEITGTSSLIANTIQAVQLPPASVVILIPFVLAVLTGYNLGAMALSYPLVESFFDASGFGIAGGTSLVYAAAAAGYLISPLHLCNALSSECLRTDTTRMYPYLIPATAIILLTQTAFILLFG
jgi:uncharacterized protein